MREPWSGLAENLGLLISLAPQAKAFMVRLLVEYQADTPQGRKTERLEIPASSTATGGSHGPCNFIYPRMVKRITSPAQKLESDHFVFPGCVYRALLEQILRTETNVRFERVVFYLIQFDEPLYNYYKLVRGFQDPATIRLDEPDFTNIQGGLGIFGSTSIDSSFWSLTERR